MTNNRDIEMYEITLLVSLTVPAKSFVDAVERAQFHLRDRMDGSQVHVKDVWVR